MQKVGKGRNKEDQKKLGKEKIDKYGGCLVADNTVSNEII
jgi:hypothetical protein